MTADEAKAFASEWLPAWTGNDPPRLAAFYTDDVFYSDPSIPDGLSGKPALIEYLSKLLTNNPDWTWNPATRGRLSEQMALGRAGR